MSDWKEGDPDRRKSDKRYELDRKHEIAEAASEAAKVIANAAAEAINTIGTAATTAQALVALDVLYIKERIKEIRKLIEDDYVTKDSFAPVKLITYGIAAIALGAVATAVVMRVVKGS